VIQASESVGAAVKLTILARKSGLLATERLEMAVEDIEPGEQSPTLASIRLMLSFFRMPKQVRLFRKCLHALNTVIRGWC
jgi:hypothetical protein